MNYLKENLQKIVDYMWRDEYKDWEEKDNPDDHIFHAFNNIKNWLVGQNAEEERQKDLMSERIMQDYEGTLSEIIKQNTNKE